MTDEQAAAWAELDRDRADAWAELDRDRAAAWDEYWRVMAPARAHKEEKVK